MSLHRTREAVLTGLLLVLASTHATADAVREALGLAQQARERSPLAQQVMQLPDDQQPSEPSPSTADVNPETLPQWFRSAEQLKQLLGGRHPGTVTNPRVVRRQPTAIEGLEALIVEATVEQDGNPPSEELFIFYVEPSGTYLMIGMLIDMKENTNLSQLTLREVRGARAESPGLALSPLTMHYVAKAGKGGLSQEPVLLVIDFGPEKGRENFLRIARFHDRLLKREAHVRPLYVLPVSTARDELSVGAMAMALGYDLLSQDGIERLTEYAAQGADAPWLAAERLASDPGLKQAMGLGIFRLQENSEQALLARLDTLPLVYRVVNGIAGLLDTPTDSDAWAGIFLQQPVSSEEQH